jgi:lysozyme
MLLRPRSVARASSVALSVSISILASGVAGCGGEGEPEPLGTAREEVVFCPGPNVVQGIDVSVYQGNIDWPAVKGSGIEFAIARVSDGTFHDTKFDQNWPAMKAAGLIRGSYQFFEPGEDPSVQADLMIQKVGVLGTGDLPCVLDVEATGGQSAGTIAANIHTWFDKIKAGTGKTPFIYTGKYFWKDNVASNPDFGNTPLWLAAYVSPCPDTPVPWTSWAMWQYSSSGKIPGIAGNVDLDEYNGTLQDLKAFAGLDPDWGAKYVSQSFPLASVPLVMTVNQTIAGDIELENVGKKAWDASTKLGTTQPRDRASELVAADWLAPNRPSGVKGTIMPGESYKFAFSLHAPNKPGTYLEYFGVLEEGVAWFSDAGQGGPPDNQLEVQVQVIAAEYQAELVKQSFPTLAEAPIDLQVGASLDGWIDLKNVGTAPWKAGETMLAPTPRDKDSALAAPSWLSPTRVSTLTSDVKPGEVGHFALTIFGGSQGDFTQTLGLVEEGVTWFADAPKGGGPADDFLAIHVVVGPDTQGGVGGGGGSDGASGSTVTGSTKGGCSCDVAADTGSPSGAWLGAAAMALVAGRRRLPRRARTRTR